MEIQTGFVQDLTDQFNQQIKLIQRTRSQIENGAKADQAEKNKQLLYQLQGLKSIVDCMGVLNG